jgi:hypothetical protein
VLGALAPLAAWAAGTLGLHPGVWTTALGAVGAVLASAASVAWAVQYRYYAVVLRDAGKRKGSIDRQPYEALRQRLRDQGARLTYEAGLAAALAWLERALGDAGVADTSWAARRFALPGAPPLWTARSYDRCLLLALVYPVLTILILWVVTGHQGPAEASLRFGANVHPARRALALGGIVSEVFSLIMLMRAQTVADTLARFAVTVALAFAFAGAVVVAGAGAGAGAVVIVSVVAGAGAGAVAGVIDGAGAVAVASVVVGALAVAGAVAVAVAVAVAFAVFSNLSRRRGWEQWFLLGLAASGLLGCWLAVPIIAYEKNFPIEGLHLLFLGLLTFVNAPFDWLSIGLTRGLLRRGLVQRGWWPYGFALLDAIAATILIAALAVAMVFAVQTFDDLAVWTGRKPTLPLDALFRGLHEHPGEPEYFWVYATLFSTMIPSLINLFIASRSLLQGMPWLRRTLFAHMPERGAVAKGDLVWMPLVLTLQVFLGAGLALLAQCGLFVGLIVVALPAIGLDLLSECQSLAADDWPGVVIRALLGPGAAPR